MAHDRLEKRMDAPQPQLPDELDLVGCGEVLVTQRLDVLMVGLVAILEPPVRRHPVGQVDIGAEVDRRVNIVRAEPQVLVVKLQKLASHN